MTTFTLISGIYGAQALSGNEYGFLGRDASIVPSGNGVTGSTLNGAALTVLGQILAGESDAISLGGSTFRVVIGQSGVVVQSFFLTEAGAAISSACAQSCQITNAGQLFGNGFGIILYASYAPVVSVVNNTGLIESGGHGVFLNGDLGLTRISNDGQIIGQISGISSLLTFVAAAYDQQLDLVNTGLVQGQLYAITTGDAADRVVNAGRIHGAVNLGGGDDLHDNQFGQQMGVISLGDGNDTFMGGAGAETVSGGAGVDLLDLRGGGGVTLALDAQFETAGAAAGDDFAGFEQVYGSANGADDLRGNTAANILYGFGGADSLDGADGGDVLRGGAGADTMTGGLGNDSFRFANLRDAGDVITDFSAAGAGNNDRFHISAAGFGGGLVAGTLPTTAFVTRADNLAQDADDRFIFRSTDRTLWFDADGAGTGAAVMVADLQASATMSAADIVIF